MSVCINGPHSLDPRESKSNMLSLSTLTSVVSQPFLTPPAMLCSASKLGALYVCMYE